MKWNDYSSEFALKSNTNWISMKKRLLIIIRIFCNSYVSSNVHFPNSNIYEDVLVRKTSVTFLNTDNDDYIKKQMLNTNTSDFTRISVLKAVEYCSFL